MIARFPSLRLEGGLISSDQIDTVAEQKAKEFNIDTISDAWSRLLRDWDSFQKMLEKTSESDPATSLTRNRWMSPFFSELGYDLSPSRSAAEIDGQTFWISHWAGKDENSPPIHIVGIRQKLGDRPASGRPRLAPHSLLQEYLNRTEHLWGIVTNGSTLRILRNSNLLRKQAYIEFDLEQIMRDELFADFALLFRLIHASRLPKGIDDAGSCALEQLHKQTMEQGDRVRDHLRDRVKEALEQFANGFLNHKNNTKLRGRVQDKSLEASEFYKQLLRLIYRLIFLMVSEERNLISDNKQYREHYSISRIRRLVEVRAAYTKQEDLWLSLALTFKLFQDESLGPLLSVPTLNGDLFDPTRTSELNEISFSNRDLLLAMWEICMYREKANTPWRRINYAALDVEELGSVYESLLDYQPVFVEQNGKLRFTLLTGTERKSTGSYYTPPELVNELIQSALVPVIKDRLASTKTTIEKETTLLSLTVCDPACGSGHFLLAAARTIGRELARARMGDEEPAPEHMRMAVRDTITHCIYGVDKNPLAVDLCKVALWLEGHTKSKPLTFLDHRVRCGDSLVGVYDLSVLKEGIPDEAFAAVIGDDKAAVRDLKKQNKKERENRNLTSFDIAINTLTNSRQQMNAISDDKPEDIRKKKELFNEFQKDGTPWCKDKTACDLWTTAFFIEISKENRDQHFIPTTTVLREYLSVGTDADLPQIKIARRFANQFKFFHWALEFPEVFIKGGFDCVIGNPPWDMVKENSDEFFSVYDPNFRSLTVRAKKIKISEILANHQINEEWQSYGRKFDKLIHFFTTSKQFQFQGTGHINSYKLFLERFFCIAQNSKNFGIVIPSGIYTDEGCTDLRKMLFNHSQLFELFCFENRNKIFAIHSSFKFVIISAKKGSVTEKFNCGFMLQNLHDVRKLRENGLKLSTNLISKFSPDTLSIMEFSNQNEIKLIENIFDNHPLLGEKLERNWNAIFHREINQTDDFEILLQQPSEIPVFEGKMIHHFYNKFKEPVFWIKKVDAENFYSNDEIPRWQLYRLGYREVASSTNETSLLCTIIPKNTATIESLRVIESIPMNFKDSGKYPRINYEEQLYLTAVLNSYILNFIIRRKITSHLSAFYIAQLPVPRLSRGNWYYNQLVPRSARLICIGEEYSDLWKSTYLPSWNRLSTKDDGISLLSDWSLLSDNWTSICGVYGWDSTKHDIDERAQLRAEIEGLTAHLYNLTKEEFVYILSTFPGVRENAPWLIENAINEYDRIQKIMLH
jgi:type I restriction-modification system DNA methylase subunit